MGSNLFQNINPKLTRTSPGLFRTSPGFFRAGPDFPDKVRIFCRPEINLRTGPGQVRDFPDKFRFFPDRSGSFCGPDRDSSWTKNPHCSSSCRRWNPVLGRFLNPWSCVSLCYITSYRGVLLYKACRKGDGPPTREVVPRYVVACCCCCCCLLACLSLGRAAGR